MKRLDTNKINIAGTSGSGISLMAKSRSFSARSEAIALVPLDSDVDPLTLYFES